MTARRQTMGRSEADRIIVRGLDLCEQVIGHLDFGAMVFLELVGRMPSKGEGRMVNAVLVSLVEHGITPSALSARLTAYGAPDALQGTVAAGLLGVGGGLVGAMEDSARLLQRLAGAPEAERDAAIDAEIHRARESGARLPGLGHPIHKPIDPRTPRLLAIAQEAGTAGAHQTIALRLHARAEAIYERNLPLNVDGAIAAVLSDVGFPWQICRGFALIARSAGLVGHAWDESQRPVARELWHESEASVPYEDPLALF